MEEVARILGVELGEEFMIYTTNDGCATAKLTKSGLHFVDRFKGLSHEKLSVCLNELLVGTFSIKRKPWNPSIGERYYYIDIDMLVSKVWARSVTDLSLYKIGNCYRTPREAETNKDKWISFYSSNNTLEV